MRSPLLFGAGAFLVPVLVAALPGCIAEEDALPVCAEPPSSFSPDGDLDLVAIGPENHRAYRIVFVAVGHSDDEMSKFVEHTGRLANDLRADRESIVGRRPELFDFYRATRPVRSADGSWPCLKAKDDPSLRPSLMVPDVVTNALMEPMPGRTILVEVLNRGGGNPNADGARELGPDDRSSIRIAPDSGLSVVEHELGHAVIGLADEYTFDGANGCYPEPITDLPPGAPQPFPNLSPHADGRDWKGLVSGAVPGGAAFYDACIYHPTDSCRMLGEDYDHWCPVCDAAIHRALGRAARDLGNPNNPPACVVTSTRDENALRVRVVSWSYVFPLKVTVENHREGWRAKEKSYGWALRAPHLVDHRVDIPLEGLEFPVRIVCTDGSPNVAVERIDR